MSQIEEAQIKLQQLLVSRPPMTMSQAQAIIEWLFAIFQLWEEHPDLEVPRHEIASQIGRGCLLLPNPEFGRTVFPPPLADPGYAEWLLVSAINALITADDNLREIDVFGFNIHAKKWLQHRGVL